MSKAYDAKVFGIKGYPTFRLYQKPNVFEEYRGEELNSLDMLDFLKKHGAINFKEGLDKKPHLLRKSEKDKLEK